MNSKKSREIIQNSEKKWERNNTDRVKTGYLKMEYGSSKDEINNYMNIKNNRFIFLV